ncbi:nucleotidyltransferase domain-containing protein [candidate division KSB1 bacterium]|nr:nucleotidyltransferase domain-containing protein [candidate division KSB1 bacterium]
MGSNESVDKLVLDLKERAKELACLYEIQELFNNPAKTMDDVCKGIVKAIPAGWQFPEVCQAKLTFHDQEFTTEDFQETSWSQCASIKVQDEIVGNICVLYTEERPLGAEGPFLKEERKLLTTIADQFGLYVLHQQLKTVFKQQQDSKGKNKSEWGVILDLLTKTDPKLLIRISRKMVNYLSWSGVQEAQELLEYFSPAYKDENELFSEANRPFQNHTGRDLLSFSYDVFEVAAKYLNVNEVLDSIQKWIKEDRSGFLVNTLEDTGSSLSEISNAIERYHHLTPHGLELSSTREMSFRVALVRRILSDQPDFINVAKQFIEVDDFNSILHRIIYPIGSHGKLGGKSSGLFLAKQILKKSLRDSEFIRSIRTPKTWYLTSDSILKFIDYNNLEDIIEQKYKDIGQVRQEYPYVVNVFKGSTFPPEIINGLSLTLDDLGTVPLIVRSSSLLEDRLGSSFAGKYKSLFIANQGSKEERLKELMDAITEVYASVFGPDPIEYRARQGILDYHEEMGIMIQEVVGKKVGKYYVPAFAGVALSQNEFRWSNRIKRKDGLLRIVPGLGTRAVDRLSDDYPILIAPGQPNLRVNVTLDEIIRYSPKHIDVINLESRTFESLDVREVFKECGSDFPYISKLVSILDENHIRRPRAIGTDYDKETLLVTFDGLIESTPFIKQMHTILTVLQENYKHPVDIEFAHDGVNLYLLQCRGQSYGIDSKPAQIPKDILPQKILFTANKHISNGIVNDITHLVYVNPQKYSELSRYHDLLAVGNAVGKLNKILPKRQFILMGPGRWGSRGDIKLGVRITYSDINNTSMLIEIARKQKDYVPDLSFGTHFFQDLVEAKIRYLPLYPDDAGIVFNEEFLGSSENIFHNILPDYAYLSEVIKVIDVGASTSGCILQVLMNAETKQALAMFAPANGEIEMEATEEESPVSFQKYDVHWRWRLRNVEGLAAHLDPARFGVKGFYIFGSTKNATAGPNSDIDILIHFNGSEAQKNELRTWLEGYSQSLSQINFMRTGYKSNGLLDVHFVTDEDIANRTGYASKIGAVTDAARPLAVGTALK